LTYRTFTAFVVDGYICESGFGYPKSAALSLFIPQNRIDPYFQPDGYGRCTNTFDAAITADNVADLYRFDELNRVDRYSDYATLRGFFGQNATSDINLRYQPAAEYIAIGVGVRRHGEGAEQQIALRLKVISRHISGFKLPQARERRQKPGTPGETVWQATREELMIQSEVNLSAGQEIPWKVRRHNNHGATPMQKTVLVLLLFVTTGLVGCASTLSGESYSRSEARTVQQVEYGIIEQLRPVKIEGTKTPIGSGAGALVGGIAGSSVGGHTTSKVMAVIGAVAGGVAGAAIEEGVTRTHGVEITVKMNDGRTIAVVQALAPNERFSVGERVRVIHSGQNTRVAH
jgi:outer membrane lipoprotein SlyB